MDAPHDVDDAAFLGTLGDRMLQLASPPRPRSARALATGGPVVQVLVPPAPWDWPEPAPGCLPWQAAEWCERVPARSAPGRFQEAPGRFPRAYGDLLTILSTAPKTAPFAKRALAALRPPPADATAAPPGWMRVDGPGGVLRWSPEWRIDPLPSGWRIGGGTSAEGGIDLFALMAEPPTLTPAAAPGLPVAAPIRAHGAELTAKRWGVVTLSPGDWFDATPLRLAEQGIVPRGYVARATPGQARPGQVPLLGEDGILPGRVSGLVVADAPVLELEVHAEDALAWSAAGAAGAHVGSFYFPAGTADAPQATPAGTATIRLRADGDGPYVVAALVEAY